MKEQNLERKVHLIGKDEYLCRLFEAEQIAVGDIIDFTEFNPKYVDFVDFTKRAKELVTEIVEDGISTISQHGVGTSKIYIQDIYYEISTDIQSYMGSNFFLEYNESGYDKSGTTRKPDKGEFQKNKDMLIQAGIWQGD